MPRSATLIVWIDDRRAGKIKPGTLGEFVVEPGEHRVAVSMAWVRSRPIRVVVGDGSRTELQIGCRSGLLPKHLLLSIFLIFLIMVVAQAFIEVLSATVLAGTNWLVRAGLNFAVYFLIFVLLTLWLQGDSWALFTLEPSGTSSPRESVGG